MAIYTKNGIKIDNIEILKCPPVALSNIAITPLLHTGICHDDLKTF